MYDYKAKNMAKNIRYLAMRDICRLSRLKENVRF